MLVILSYIIVDNVYKHTGVEQIREDSIGITEY